MPTHLLGDWNILAANMRGKEERGMISLRTEPVHAWVRVTREKILILGREPHSEINFVEGEFFNYFFWKRDASQNQSSTCEKSPPIRTEGDFSS